MNTQLDQRSIPARPAGIQRWATRLGVVATAWALFFTLEHIYWLAGGTWLLNPTMAPDVANLVAQNPWSYVLESAILVALFAIVALFPLALTWPGRPITQHNLQRLAVSAGYLAMIVMAAYSFATQSNVIALACLGVCVLGGGVALLRPHGESAARWQILVGLWFFGAGMTLYGGVYLVTALRDMQAPYFVQYLLAGGMNWTVEGLLFLAVAGLASFGARLAHPRLTHQPA